MDSSSPQPQVAKEKIPIGELAGLLSFFTNEELLAILHFVPHEQVKKKASALIVIKFEYDRLIEKATGEKPYTGNVSGSVSGEDAKKAYEKVEKQ